jgi:adenine-specific DNA-methyltransferase
MKGVDLRRYGLSPEALLGCIRDELEVIRVVPDAFDERWRKTHRRWAAEGPDPWNPAHALVEEILGPVMDWLGEWHAWRAGVFESQAALSTREALASLSLLPAKLAEKCRRDPQLIAWWQTSLGIPEGTWIAEADLPVYTPQVEPLLRDAILRALESAREASGTGLLIHGGALSALDLLRSQEHPPIDVVYIDPPYNTGNRGFRYNDAFPREVWRDWLGRCFASAHSLCSSRASVWASIDDHAVHDLRRVMDEAFGSSNHLGTVAWRKKVVRGRGAKHLIPQVEYIHVHAIDVAEVEPFEEDLTEAMLAEYRLSDDRGPYKRIPLAKSGTAQSPRPNLVYSIEAPDGTLIACPTHQWRWSRETLARRMDEIEFVVGKDKRWRVFTRQRPTVDGRPRGRTPSTLQDRHTTTDGTRELKDVLGELAVGFPKPMGLIQDILTWTSSNGRKPARWVLDFFGGTGTSVDAVLHWRMKHPEAEVRIVCVEAGPWFEDALVCRVARRACSRTWRKGQPNEGPGMRVHFDVWTLPEIEVAFEALPMSS